jgi:hypothetical protein
MGRKCRLPEMIGNQYRYLFVLGEVKSPRGERLAWCRCTCDRELAVRPGHLGMIASCGCMKGKLCSASSTKHGASKSPEYIIYTSMIARCCNQNNKSYKDYGERGIKVCGRWRHGENGKSGFECFIEDVGARPSTKHSLERRENDGHYDPDNCEWATRQQQCRNTRRTKRVIYNNTMMSLTEACERAGISYGMVQHRLRRNQPHGVPGLDTEVRMI